MWALKCAKCRSEKVGAVGREVKCLVVVVGDEIEANWRRAERGREREKGAAGAGEERKSKLHCQ